MDPNYKKTLQENLGIKPIHVAEPEPRVATFVQNRKEKSFSGDLVEFPKDIFHNKRPVGLVNQISTCWINSAIQLLSSIPAFRNLILELLPSFSSEMCLLSLQKLIIVLNYCDVNFVDPKAEIPHFIKLIGPGQQDMAELVAVLFTRISEMDGKVLKMFSISLNKDGDTDYTQYTLQVNRDGNLWDAIYYSLKGHLPTSRTTSPRRAGRASLSQESRHWFHTLPPVFCVGICRLENQSGDRFVKNGCRFSFPAVLFADKFLVENKEAVLQLEEQLGKLKADKKKCGKDIESYQQVLESYSIVDSDASSNEQLEKSVKEKINELLQEVERCNSIISTLEKCPGFYRRPYLLHAVVIHAGQSNSGHYYIFTRFGEKWYCINDKEVTESNWEEIVEQSYGGNILQTSASSLVYVDAAKIKFLKDDVPKKMNPQLRPFLDQITTKLCRKPGPIGKANIPSLRDVDGPQHFSSSKDRQQTVAAILETRERRGPDETFYEAINLERDRLYGVYFSASEDVRLKHIVLYMLANHVQYYPLIHWTLLQHFASLPVYTTSKKCKDMRQAAEEALAHMESCVLDEERTQFVAWNLSFKTFCEATALLAAGVEYLTKNCYIMAMEVFMQAVLENHRLLQNEPLGNQVGLNEDLVDAFVSKGAKLLCEELNLSDDRLVEAEVFLFEPVALWAVHRNSPAVWSAALNIINDSRYVSSSTSLAVSVILERNASFPVEKFHSAGCKVYSDIGNFEDKLGELDSFLMEAKIKLGIM